MHGARQSASTCHIFRADELGDPHYGFGPRRRRVSDLEMFPFELMYPGQVPVCPGVAFADVRDALSLFYVLETHLSDAAVGLRLFEQERERANRRLNVEPAWVSTF